MLAFSSGSGSGWPSTSTGEFGIVAVADVYDEMSDVAGSNNDPAGAAEWQSRRINGIYFDNLSSRHK